MYTLKKSLGQHFLHDENILAKIMEALKKHPVKNLLEVGPGAGALTKHLIELPGINLKAIELDTEKVAYLISTYPALKDKLIHKNFLDSEKPFDEPFIVIGNFPYNISTQILFKVLDWKDEVPVVIGMFQKEVAQRVAAKEGSKTYGVISVLIQAYYEVTYLFDVAPGCFTPPPKINSGVIELKVKSSKLNVKGDKEFFLLVKTAFNQRRKQLRNAVKPLFDEEVLKDELFTKRAEQLSVTDFAALTFRMK